jgi:hypothetical protein
MRVQPEYRVAVPVQRTVGADLQKLVERIPAWAEGKGLQALAAVPQGEGRHVLLTGDEVGAEGFIDLSHTCGARVLYFDSVVFAAEEFAVLGDNGSDPGSCLEDELSPEAQKELKQLRRAARTHAGETTVW